EQEAEPRRRKPLGDVQQRDAEPDLEAHRPPDVRRTGAPAAGLADVHALEQPRQPVAPGHAPEEVTGEDQEGVPHERILRLTGADEALLDPPVDGPAK